MNADRSSVKGMIEDEIGRHKQEPADPEIPSEEAVVVSIAVFRISYYRMGSVGEVSANLVMAAGAGEQTDKRIASGLISAHGRMELDDRLSSEICDGREVVFAVGALQRIVEPSRLVDVTAHHGQITLSNKPPSEVVGEFGCGFGSEREDNDSGCCAVDSMDRIDESSQLITEELEARRLAGAPGIPMDQHSAGFVYGDIVFVMKEDFKHGSDLTIFQGRQTAQGLTLRAQQFQMWRLPTDPAIHFLRYCRQESVNRHENGGVPHTVRGDSKNGRPYLESLLRVFLAFLKILLVSFTIGST